MPLEPLERVDLLLVNAMGDLSDLLPMFIEGGNDELRDGGSAADSDGAGERRDSGGGTPDDPLSGLSPEDAWIRLVTGGHCSSCPGQGLGSVSPSPPLRKHSCQSAYGALFPQTSSVHVPY